jgi:hypothetical protein
MMASNRPKHVVELQRVWYNIDSYVVFSTYRNLRVVVVLVVVVVVVVVVAAAVVVVVVAAAVVFY